MSTLDASEEWLRLSQLYRGMTDEELLSIARKFAELTEIAQPILAQELRVRRLEMPSAEEEPAPPPEADPDDPYAEDRELVGIRTVWSEADARQLEDLLDAAGIPFFIGPEKATRVDKVTSHYAQGIDVAVRRIGLPWAAQALKDYHPANEPDTPEEIVPEELTAHCPRCGSEDVMCGDETTAPEGVEHEGVRLGWTCASCGHRWRDEDLTKEIEE